MLIGCIGMGVHLFLFDGITNPTDVLTFFAVLFGVGMYANTIGILAMNIPIIFKQIQLVVPVKKSKNKETSAKM